MKKTKILKFLLLVASVGSVALLSLALFCKWSSFSIAFFAFLFGYSLALVVLSIIGEWIANKHLKKIENWEA